MTKTKLLFIWFMRFSAALRIAAESSSSYLFTVIFRTFRSSPSLSWATTRRLWSNDSIKHDNIITDNKENRSVKIISQHGTKSPLPFSYTVIYYTISFRHHTKLQQWNGKYPWPDLDISMYWHTTSLSNDKGFSKTHNVIYIHIIMYNM